MCQGVAGTILLSYRVHCGLQTERHSRFTGPAVGGSASPGPALPTWLKKHQPELMEVNSQPPEHQPWEEGSIQPRLPAPPQEGVYLRRIQGHRAVRSRAAARPGFQPLPSIGETPGAGTGGLAHC